jgi:2-methylisocitrate lyase-like PEP mutase family enzyme
MQSPVRTTSVPGFLFVQSNSRHTYLEDRDNETPGTSIARSVGRGHQCRAFIGIYDCFSATIAAPYSSNLFLSGFGFSAGYYGLPDVGYVSWSDIVGAAWRLRQILPGHTLLVDIDDGFVDIHTACHVVAQLEHMGVAMVMLEDQARPRRCGHAEGKRLLSLPDYMEKLMAVLERREEMCVLARTDAAGDDIFRRVAAMSETDADVLLVDGIDSIETLARVLQYTDKPLLFNQIAGGKSPRLSIGELRQLGVRLVQYSTPLLFAAQQAMASSLQVLFNEDGRLPPQSSTRHIGVRACTALLEGNVAQPANRDLAGLQLR